MLESSEKRIALNAGSKYAATAFRMLVYLILTPYLIHSVGKTFYGLQTLAGQALQFVALASTAIGISYDRFATQHYARGEYEEMNAVLSVGLGLSMISALLYAVGTIIVAVFAATLFGLPESIVGTARVIILITGCAATLHMLYKVWLAPVFVTQRFYLDSISSLICNGGGLVAVWLAFELHRPSIITWVIISTGFRIGTELLFVVPRCKRALPQLRPRLGRVRFQKQALAMMSFSALNFVGGLSHLMYYASDSIIVSNLNELGPGMIAYYSVAQRWDPQIRMLVMAFVAVLVPMMTGDAAVGNVLRLRNTVTRGTRYALILAILPCLLLMVFAYPFFHHWLGEDFAATCAPITRLILCGFLMYIPGVVAYEVLFARGRIGGVVFWSVLGGALNIGLSVVLVKFAGLGLLGVAIGSVSSMILMNAFYIPYLMSREIDLPLGPFFRDSCGPALRGALPAVLVALLIRRTWEPGNLYLVLVQFATVSLVYAGSVWRLSLNSDDRGKLMQGVRVGWAMLSALQERGWGGRKS